MTQPTRQPRRRIAVGAIHHFLNVWDRAPASARPKPDLVPLCRHDGPQGMRAELNPKTLKLDVTCRACGALVQSLQSAQGVAEDLAKQAKSHRPRVCDACIKGREEKTPGMLGAPATICADCGTPIPKGEGHYPSSPRLVFTESPIDGREPHEAWPVGSSTGGES